MCKPGFRKEKKVEIDLLVKSWLIEKDLLSEDGHYRWFYLKPPYSSVQHTLWPQKFTVK